MRLASLLLGIAAGLLWATSAGPILSHPGDADSNGNGTVVNAAYISASSEDPTDDHTFEIQFLDPGVEAFSFTFG